MNVTVPAILNGLRTIKDGSISVTLSLQEVSPEMAARCFQMQNQFIKCYITTDNITQDSKDLINSWELEHESKSPSKRMRNVFFRMWEQDSAGYEDFELYYQWQMNKIIEHFKNKLT